MGYAKERGKLLKVSTKIVGLDVYNEKNFAILVDAHEQFSHTIRILKNKEPEAFIDLYKNELEEIKAGRKAVKESEAEESRQENFILYKNLIVSASEKTIRITRDFV